jgi:hypothetical protein
VTSLDTFEQFGQSFKAAMAAVRRLRGRETHRPGELSYAQYGLLFSLAAGGALSAGELAVAADVSPASATQMLGRQVVEARRSLLEPLWRAALAEFSAQDLQTAAAVLDRITEMFDELAAERPEDDKLTPAA